MKSRNSAFTLIELLVVIAIIGILAGVVIASLNSARNKGRVASIKSNLRNAVSQSNIYFNENGTYTGFCSDPTIVSILAALGGSTAASCYVHTNADIRDVDFGIATTFDGINFVADPLGVIQFDTTNTSSGLQWEQAMATCMSNGKRLAGGSSLKALRDLVGSTSNMGGGSYWSHTENPTNTLQAFRMNFGSDATFGGVLKTETTRSTRCGS